MVTLGAEHGAGWSTARLGAEILQRLLPLLQTESKWKMMPWVQRLRFQNRLGNSEFKVSLGGPRPSCLPLPWQRNQNT